MKENMKENSMKVSVLPLLSQVDPTRKKKNRLDREFLNRKDGTKHDSSQPLPTKEYNVAWLTSHTLQVIIVGMIVLPNLLKPYFN
jgi:hypothetical protein